MKTRKLGALEVSAVGMGCMGMSHAAGKPLDIDEAVRIVRKAVDMGYTFFDNAKNYGYKDDPDVPPLIYDSSREGIWKSVEGSLKRLNTNYIDLYFQARIDPEVEPKEVAETLAELIREGKILHWGVFEIDAAYLNRVNAVCPVTAVENAYNMIRKEHEALIPVLEENHIGWVAHGPMFKGLLGGTFQKGVKFARDDWRGRLVNDENLERYQPLIEYLTVLGEEKGATPGELSLAWILHQKTYIVPIPGMRSSKRIVENAKAADIVLSFFVLTNTLFGPGKLNELHTKRISGMLLPMMKQTKKSVLTGRMQPVLNLTLGLKMQMKLWAVCLEQIPANYPMSNVYQYIGSLTK